MIDFLPVDYLGIPAKGYKQNLDSGAKGQGRGSKASCCSKSAVMGEEESGREPVSTCFYCMFNSINNIIIFAPHILYIFASPYTDLAMSQPGNRQKIWRVKVKRPSELGRWNSIRLVDFGGIQSL